MDKSRNEFEFYMFRSNVCTRLSRQPESAGGAYKNTSVERAWDLWQASRKQALEEAAQVADRTSNSGQLLLTAGEMNAGEMRTTKAILGYVGRAIRSLEGNATKEAI